MKRLRLSDGNQIPCMGFGCFNGFGQELTDAVRTALDAGCRFIDSAANYKNEDAVGAALKQTKAPREEIFVLSKVWPTFFDDPQKSFDQTMRDLGVDYLDAFLLHWPGTDMTKRLKTYEFVLSMKEKGLIRTVGVSNFLEKHLEEIKQEFGAYPAIDEIECHPTFQQRELIRFCYARGIQTVAYSPINRGVDLGNAVTRALADKYGKSETQIILKWHVQHDQIPIPKSLSREHIFENLNIFDFALTPEEMAAVDGLENGERRGKDPMTFDGKL